MGLRAGQVTVIQEQLGAEMITKRKQTRGELFAELLIENPKALVADGLDGAYVGHTAGTAGVRAAYDIDECIKIFCDEHGLSLSEAEEHVDFNVIYAYVGEDTPIFIRFTN